MSRWARHAVYVDQGNAGHADWRIVSIRFSSSPYRFFSLPSSARLMVRQHDQVMAKHAQPHSPGKTLKPLEKTTNPAKSAFQAGNSPLDPGTKCLTTGQHLVHEVLHPSRDCQVRHQLRQLLILALLRAEPLVRRQHLRTLSEQLLVTLDHRLGQVGIRLLLLINLVVSDELLRRLAQQHLVAELHRLLPPPTLDQLRVRLEQAEHAIAGRNRLAVPPGPPRRGPPRP